METPAPSVMARVIHFVRRGSARKSYERVRALPASGSLTGPGGLEVCVRQERTTDDDDDDTLQASAILAELSRRYKRRSDVRLATRKERERDRWFMECE